MKRKKKTVTSEFYLISQSSQEFELLTLHELWRARPEELAGYLCEITLRLLLRAWIYLIIAKKIEKIENRILFSNNINYVYLISSIENDSAFGAKGSND